MITRRGVVVGGLSAALAAAAGATVRALQSSPVAIRVVAPSSVPAVGPVATSATSSTTTTTTPVQTTIDQPTPSTSPADCVDAPLRVDWIGGSDVAWRGVSLPDAFVRRVQSVGGRTLEMRTRLRQALMPVGAVELVREAIAAGTEAIVMSLNLVWVYWDGASCDELTVPHERYGCLLTPNNPAIIERRKGELQALIDLIVDAGLPAYLYTQPHSADVLADPTVSGPIADGEARIAALDPQRPHVRLVANIFTRTMPPLVEGIDFVDMVHPTAKGAEALADWLAGDITAFWASAGVACPATST